MPDVHEVPLSQVEYDVSVYPRSSYKTSTIKEYVDALRSGAVFPAVILEEGTNRILDGVHRFKAFKAYLEEYREKEQQTELIPSGFKEWAAPPETIPSVFRSVPEGIPIKLFAASFSTNHGDRITVEDKRQLARDTYEKQPDFKLETLAEYLGISKSSASEYTADIRAKRREQQRSIAYRLHLLGWTQEEIASVIGCSRENFKSTFLVSFPDLENTPKKLVADGIPYAEVAERFKMQTALAYAIGLDGKDDEARMEILKIKIQPYDVWHFNGCSDLFGSEYPGRIPGEVVAHILYFFTEPDAVAIDPMAGSGTTVDVCLTMGRRCYAYDIDKRTERPDIIVHDMKTGWPERVKKASIIIWDAPYFDKKDDLNIEGGYAEGSISKLPQEEYLATFAKLFKDAKEQVKKGTKLAFLMSDWDDGNGNGIFEWDYARLIQDAGWRITRQIQVPLPTQQVHPDIMLKFRKARRLARLTRYLLIAEA